MDRGDYRLATTASTHGLTAYPSCLAAHRILGEAYLELGSTDPATKHFEHTLAVDPLNVVARLGLGVASEEQKDYGAAYAHYLHAWEINPALDQVRDELVRLRGLLGVEDRLHPTRAGLAGIHARGGQLHRAANEWRAVLAVEPESRRARTSFAELLWRQGEDGLAAVACRDALRGSPENARALAMLADTERRRGGAGADEFAERYRAVDPTGDVLKLLSEWRSDVDLGFLATDSALVDDFDFSAHAVPSDQLGAPTKVATNALAGNQIAAPDLWDTLVKDLTSELPATGVAPTLASGVEPFAWNDGGPVTIGGDDFADLGIQPFNADDLDGDVRPFSFTAPVAASAVHDVSTADIYTAALSKSPAPAGEPEPVVRVSSISEDDGLAALFAPSTDREIAAAIPSAAPADEGGASRWGGSGDGNSETSGASDGFDDLAALGIVPFSFDGLPDELPGVDDPASYAPRPAPQPSVAPDGAAQAAAAVPESVVERPAPAPTAAAIGAEPLVAPPVFVDPFVGADGKIDLTVGWDELDKSLEAATPSLEAVGRYDDLAAELDRDGILPFDADIPGEDEDAWAPLTEDDFGMPAVAAAGSAPLPPPVDGDDLAISEQVPTVAEWLVDDVSLTLEEPSALEALMALPAIDEPITAEPAAGDLSVAAAVEDVDVEDGLIGNDLSAIPVTFDDEVIFGIPSQQASGYTELLRHVDVEEPDGGESVRAELDPFVSPDSNGDPLAFEDLLAVTSQDGTSELVAPAGDHAMTAASPLAALESDPSSAEPSPITIDHPAASDVADLDLGGLDPFDLDELNELAELNDLETSRAGAATAAQGEPFDLDLSGLSPGIYTGILEAEQPAELHANSMPEPFSVAALGAEDRMPATAGADAASDPERTMPFDFEATLAEDELASPGADSSEPIAATAVPDGDSSALDETASPDWSGSGGLGMAIGSVVWPTFVNQTSDLIDRDRGNGSVFTRLRTSKAALVAGGQLIVDRRLAVPAASPVVIDTPTEMPPPQEVAAVAVAVAEAEAPPEEFVERRRQRPEMSEQTRLDLMAMRVRLIEDADSAQEVAVTVERAVGEGLGDPLALRILGEAYLKLGKMEQAAAQFRQAMLARQRTR